MEEGQVIEDIDAEGVVPITKVPTYMPPRKGKVKVLGMESPHEMFLGSNPMF